ncbi:MAG: MFS transporter [Candidatus Bathyarchaeia archaeon]
MQRSFHLLNRSLFCMCVMTFLVAMGYSIIVPVLPLYARDFGASNLQIGAVIAGFALTRTAFNIPAGIFAGKVGSKKSMLLGLIFVGVTSAIIGLARNYETVLLARTIAGVGSAFYVTSSVTYMAELTTKGKRGRSMSIYDGVGMVGSTIGPAIGGVLSYVGGRNLPFLAYACSLFAAAVFVQLLLPEATEKVQRQFPNYLDLKRTYGDRSFLSVNTSTFMYSFVLTSMQFTIIPLFAVGNVGLNSLQIGGLFTVLSVAELATFIPIGSLSDRFGRKPFMISSLIVSSIVLIVMSHISNPVGFGLAMGMLGFGSGLAGPMDAWISDLAPKDKLGVAIGLYRTLNDIGLVAGPIFLTALTQTHQATAEIPSTPFLVGGILMAGTTILLSKAKDPVRDGRE